MATKKEIELRVRTFNTLTAGRVQRFHAHTEVDRKQTVAEHSWGVCVILHYLLHDRPTELGEAISLAIVHDAAEWITGDIPFTVKRDWPDISPRLTEIEAYVHENEVLPLPNTQHVAHMTMKLADMLEGMTYCIDHEKYPFRAYHAWDEAIYSLSNTLVNDPLFPCNSVIGRALEIKVRLNKHWKTVNNR